MSQDCSYPVTDTAAFQDTDDADAVTVLAAVRHCANSWEGDARLLGNVRARDIARACTLAIDALSQPVSVAQAAPNRDQLIALIRSKARVAGHDAWEGGYYHIANAEEIADAILALSSTEGN